MFNKKVLNLVFGAAMASMGFSVLAADTTTVNGGTVHFTGSLVNAACAVSAGTENQTVALGQYRTASFGNVIGNYSGAVPFTIVLEDCDADVAQTAAVAFTGAADGTDNTVLSVSNISGGGTTNSARGVGIEISDSKGNVLQPDGAAYSTAQALISGSNTLNFTARYKSTSTEISAGQADADATFVLKYE